MTQQFLFASARAAIASGSIDLETDILYARLAVTPPDEGMSTANEIFEVSYTGYEPVALQNKTFLQGVLRADPIEFPIFESSPGTLTGVVLCKMQGSAPAPADPLLSFFRFRDPFNSPIDLVPSEGLRLVVENLGGEGLLQVKTPTVFRAGPRINRADRSGVFYLLGSNNRQREFSLRDKLSVYTLLPTGNFELSARQTILDRVQTNITQAANRVVLSEFQPAVLIALHGEKALNLSSAQLMLLHSSAGSDSNETVLEIRVSNYLPNYYDGAPQVSTALLSQHTELIETFAVPSNSLANAGTTFLHRLPLGDDQFWKFIILTRSELSTAAQLGLAELEIYDALIASETPNLS